MSLDIAYYSFNQRRADGRWENFSHDFEECKKIRISKNKGIKLTSKEEDGQYFCDLDGMIFSEENMSGLLFAMCNIDLNYGGIVNDYFEDNKVASLMMEDLLPHIFDLTNSNGDISTEKLVRLHQNLNKADVEKIAKALEEELDWSDEPETASWYVVDFFRSIKPIVQDLKDNPDSILVLTTGGYDEFNSKSSEEILYERARKHVEKFKDILSTKP